jgi:hypothetical protein
MMIRSTVADAHEWCPCTPAVPVVQSFTAESSAGERELLVHYLRLRVVAVVHLQRVQLVIEQLYMHSVLTGKIPRASS